MSTEVPPRPATLSDFDQLMAEIEDEARAEGPQALAQLDAFGRRFAEASERIARRLEG